MWKEILKAPPSWEVDISDLPPKTRIALSKEKKITPRKYTQRFSKPNGLWYSFSDEYNWMEWLKDSMPDWDSNYDHMITFDITGRILTFTSQKDFTDFINKYGTLPEKSEIDIIWEKHFDYANVPNLLMKWDEVAQDYDVLEFDYHPSFADYDIPNKFNGKVFWVRNLDIKSGVVLNTSAVKNQKLIASRTDKTKTIPHQWDEDRTQEVYDWKKNVT